MELTDSSLTVPVPPVVSQDGPEENQVEKEVEELSPEQVDRTDRKIQRKSILITQAPENGHPLYTLRVLKGVTVLGEVKGQFAIYRDLYTKINDNKFCDDLLKCIIMVCYLGG